MSCTHFNLASLKKPSHSARVFREECTHCFDTQDAAEGIDVCLSCYNGACVRRHADLHYTKHPTHAAAVNIKRTRKQRSEEPPPLKKIAIRQEPSEKEMYEWRTELKCYACAGPVALSDVEIQQADELVQAILSAASSAQQSEVKAWEEEIAACEHSLTLEQIPSTSIAPAHLAKCSSCELNNNLWLCLSCGSLSCGRQQFGGTGGNGHALKHFEATSHPLAVKLGTITPEGSADVYCYACNDAKIDPFLRNHLANFSILVDDQVKTEKSMTELQVEQNLKFDFAMTGADGKSLEPLFGPQLTGLKNLGNSCYMASTLQSLFALPAFQSRYYEMQEGSLLEHALICTKNPPDCVECQMLKMADGLLSGRYSVPAQHTSTYLADATSSTEENQDVKENKEEAIFQEGIKPSMFKALIGKDHEEFKTMRQQDADEFLKHLLKMLNRQQSPTSPITDIFKFQMETRLQCLECKGVKYRVEQMDSLSVPVPVQEKGMQVDGEKKEYEPVQLEKCLELLTSDSELEYKCPACNKQVKAIQSTKFSTAPQVLVVHARRFQLINWVPQKVDVPIEINLEALSLDRFFSHGRLDTETMLPDDEDEAPKLPEFDTAAMAQLEGMGFPAIRCQKALMATGNSDAEAAMNWLFEHMEDPDIDDPIQLHANSASTSQPNASPEQVSMVGDMGFTEAQANKALIETGGSVERAVEWLFSHPDDSGNDLAATTQRSSSSSSKQFGAAERPANYALSSFISHKGPSVHSGHYVSHVSTQKGWVLFNDEKVVKANLGEQAADKLSPFAYVYIFARR